MKVRDAIKQMARDNQTQKFESVVQAYKFFLKTFAQACEDFVKDQELTLTDARRELAEWATFLKPLVAQESTGKGVVVLPTKHQAEFKEVLENVNKTIGQEGQRGNDSKTQITATPTQPVGRK